MTRKTIHNLKPGDRVKVRLWGHGQRADAHGKWHGKWRWKVAVIKWVGTVGNTFGYCVRFARESDPRKKEDFFSCNEIRIPGERRETTK